MQEITFGDTVRVTAGEHKGELGTVGHINRRTRTHFHWQSYQVLFDNGGDATFEEVMLRDDNGKDKAKALDLEKVPVAKLATNEAPGEPQPPEVEILPEDQTMVSKQTPEPAKK